MVVMKRCTSLLISAIISILVLVPTTVSQSFGFKNQYKDGLRYANDYSKYLSSPNYPNNYSSNVHCKWYIAASPPSNAVVLKLLDFDLEGSSQSCIYDYVSIYDGYDTGSPIISKLCGQVSSSQFNSTDIYMTVVFRSDGSENFKGFKFEYTSTNKSDYSLMPTIENLLATESTSYIKSPNYPNNYSSNMDYRWQITTSSSLQVVVLKLLDFYLDNSLWCTNDYVTVFDGISSNSPMIQKLCGLVSRTEFISTGSSMAVVFHSDRYINNRGFKFEYTCQTKSDICMNDTLSATETAKYIVSPGYPNLYLSNIDCRWHITAMSASQVVVLNVLDFDLEGTFPSCNYDYVTIYDGYNTSFPGQVLCGQVSNKLIISTGPSITVVFHSDRDTTFKGFQFEYTSQTKSDVCMESKLATDTPQYIYSPGYPIGYTSNIDCRWHITAMAPSQVVVLNVLDFDLEGTFPSCNYDYVTIYDGYDIIFPEERKLCDRISNKVILGTGPSMTIVFHSDGSVNSKGFKFEYTSQTNSDVAISATGAPQYISSPDYPNNYPSNMNSQWHITAATSSQVVVLKLLDFFLEGSSPACSYDFVIIYNGNSTNSPVIQKLCGSVLSTQFLSTSSTMTVVFHSDGYSSFRGFKFEYTSQTKSAVCSGVTLKASSTDNSLTSPNYPSQYPNNIDCEWHITTDTESSVIVLDLVEFSLARYQTLLCSSNYVKIYDGPSTSSSPKNVLCGTLYYGRYESTGSDMTVVFHSDGGNSYNNGFRFTYKSQYSSQKSASYSQDNTGTIVAVVTCGVAVPIFFVVFVICVKRRLALRRLTNTQNRTLNQNGGDNSLFIVTLLTNNSRTPYFEEQDPQIMLDPPPYSSLNCNGNDDLPAYTTREPGYSTDDLPPPYSCYMPGGTSQGQTPLLNDPSSRKPGDDVDSAPEAGAHFNTGFTFSRDDHATGQNESTYVSSTGDTNMAASKVTSNTPSSAVGRNPSFPDNSAPTAPPEY